MNQVDKLNQDLLDARQKFFELQPHLCLRAQARGFYQLIRMHLKPISNSGAVHEQHLEMAQKLMEQATEQGVWDSDKHKCCKHPLQGVHQCERYREWADNLIQDGKIGSSSSNGP